MGKLLFILVFLVSCSSRSREIISRPDRIIPYTFTLERQRPSEGPYLARYIKDEYELSFIAADHFSWKSIQSFSDHPTLKLIERTFSRFPPQMLIVEGINTGDQISPKSQITYANECIKNLFRGNCAESDYAIHKIQSIKSDFVSGEPTHEQIKIALLKKNISHEDLLGFYLARQIPQLKRQKKFNREEFPPIAEEKLRRYAKAMHVDVKFGLREFEEWYRAHMKSPRNYLDLTNNDPAPEGGPNATYIQRISHEINLIRDRHLLERIEEMLNRHKKILVIYGGSHLLSLDPALQEMLSKPRIILNSSAN